MITTNGKMHIKRYLAQQVPAIAQSIAFGIGDSGESVDDYRLQFEVGRSDIYLVAPDFVNDKLIFKANIDAQYIGDVYEVALYSQPRSVVAGEFNSRLLTTFDSVTETWVDATSGTPSTFDSSNTRLGADSLRQTPALSTTQTDSILAINVDLSGYSSSDSFTIALNAGNTNTSSVKVLFLTDSSNYYTIDFGEPVPGYQVIEAGKYQATPTGTPDWSKVTEIRVSTTSSSAGPSQIDWDGIRVEDTDTYDADYVMVSRNVLATPFTKTDGMTQEVEFSLGISV